MEIWIHKDGEFAGRFSESAMRDKIADGSFRPTDLAWDESKSSWRPIGQFLESMTAASPASAVAPADEKPAADTVAKSSPPPEPGLASPAPSSASKPPPLPVSPASSGPVPAAGPPPLPSMTAVSGQAPASRPPEGETIWSPIAAILWSFLLSPAFGGLIVWKNWLILKRRRRAMVAAAWFWVGLAVVAVRIFAPADIPQFVWWGFTAAWIAFSAYPQIRYIQTTFKKEKTRWLVPMGAGLAIWVLSFAIGQIQAALKKTPLEPAPQQLTTQLSQSHDRVFTPDELRDIYKASVLEVRTTWKQKVKPLWLNKTESGSSGTGVLLYNDSEYGLVATNWHVVEPSESMTGDYSCGVRFSHEKDFADCLVVARAKNDVDLALLLVRLDGKWAPNQFPVRRLEQIREGEACIAIGNALGEGLSITAGIISRFDKVKEQTLIRTSTPVSPGNSGGPLILCRGGALAGIVTLQSRIVNVQNVNFATPAQYLLDKDIWEFEPDQPQAQQLLDKAIAQASKK